MVSGGASLIEVSDGKVQTESTGSGPDFVIIHSLLTGPEAFDHLASSLSRGRTVHRVFLPGFGASTPLPDPNPTVADLADVVASSMDGLQCGPETTVLGNGLGSFIGLSLAVRHGDRFKGLIASNTGPGFPEDRRGAFLEMSALADRGGMSAVADIAIRRIFPAPFLEAHPEAPAQRRAVLEEIDPGAFAAACRALAVLDLGEDLPKIENPTLVIAGEIDQTTPPEMGRAVAAAIPGARFREIPGCGHCPQLERPGALLELIRLFLSGRAS
jgi:pimeloyl-ACP methyl ester carboxylesterase